MQVVKIILAFIAALFTLSALLNLITMLPTASRAISGSSDPMAFGQVFGGILIIIAGVAITSSLWKSAAKDKKASQAKTETDPTGPPIPEVKRSK